MATGPGTGASAAARGDSMVGVQSPARGGCDQRGSADQGIWWGCNAFPAEDQCGDIRGDLGVSLSCPR